MRDLFRTKLRTAGTVFFTLPIVIALPLHYWVFNLAGSWFVSTDLEPAHRRVCLGLMFSGTWCAFAALFCFVGLLLYFIDGYGRPRTGWLLIPVSIFAFLATIFLLIGVHSYFKFG